MTRVSHNHLPRRVRLEVAAALFLALALSACTAKRESAPTAPKLTTTAPATVAKKLEPPKTAQTAAPAQPKTAAPAKPYAPPQNLTPGDWVALFDGSSLKGWKVAEEGAFSSHGEVSVQDGKIVIKTGMPFSGIVWTGEFPKGNYEVEAEAMRTQGYDIFCGLTFPVGDSPLTLVIGGWGDSVVGLSCINDCNASSNETTKVMSFKNDQWVRVQLRVTDPKIEAWIDGKQVIDLPRKDRKFTVYGDLECNRPLGFFTWETEAALRNIRMRPLKPKP